MYLYCISFVNCLVFCLMVMFVGLLRFAGPSKALDRGFTAGAQREDHYCVSFHSHSQCRWHKCCTILLACGWSGCFSAGLCLLTNWPYLLIKPARTTSLLPSSHRLHANIHWFNTTIQTFGVSKVYIQQIKNALYCSEDIYVLTTDFLFIEKHHGLAHKNS